MSRKKNVVVKKTGQVSPKKLTIPGGFLAVPNVLVDRFLKSDLSAVGLKVLLLCLRWTIGYDKETCSPTLTALERATGHKRKFLSKVLQNLVATRFLQLVTPPGFRKPAEYRVLLQWDSPTPVGLSDTMPQSDSNGTQSPTTASQTVPLQGDTT